MMGLQSLAMAAQSLWGHKMRSLLTILGVVIGIGSVLTIVTLGASFEASVLGQFDSIDDRTVFVVAGASGPQQGPPQAGPFGTIFTSVDRDGLAALPFVERVDASGAVTISSIEFANRTTPYTSLTATVPDAQELRDPGAYSAGGVFSPGTGQAVFGATVAEYVGGGALTAGDTVRFLHSDGTAQNVTVAGILTAQETLFGDANARVFVPLDPFYTFRIRSPSTGEIVAAFDGFTVIADDPRHIDEVRASVSSYMTRGSDASLLATEDTDIFVSTAGDITDAISQAFDQITVFIGGIAVVSLVVGAIGIANIMLVAVAERTREIGVMKAIGALDRQVLGLFLTEAVLVGVIGSVFGIALGLLGGVGLVKGLFADADVAVTIPYEWLGIAVVTGVGVGVVAGFLPARRATKIQPVEALAHE